MDKDYKLFIPTAGLGSRIGPYTKTKNKALVTIGDLPSIVRIIEQFPSNIDLVIALGYKGDQVKSVLDAFYPDRNKEYIFIDKFRGIDSGLGYTLIKSEPFLQFRS